MTYKTFVTLSPITWFVNVLSLSNNTFANGHNIVRYAVQRSHEEPVTHPPKQSATQTFFSFLDTGTTFVDATCHIAHWHV